MKFSSCFIIKVVAFWCLSVEFLFIRLGYWYDLLTELFLMALSCLLMTAARLAVLLPSAVSRAGYGLRTPMTVFRPSRTVAIEDFFRPKLVVVDGGRASNFEALLVTLFRKWAWAVSLSNSSMFRSSPLLFYCLSFYFMLLLGEVSGDCRGLTLLLVLLYSKRFLWLKLIGFRSGLFLRIACLSCWTLL